MKVILSIGHGRLHLASSAEWLARAGIDIRLVCGWVPSNPNGWLVRLCSRIIGRDLSNGMAKRVINVPEVETCAMPLIDFGYQALLLMDRKVFAGRLYGDVSCVGWRFYGWGSRKYLRGATSYQIFHCRSGAGQGGAINEAKKYGMKVLVDQSALHPEQSEQNLREDCKRWGVRVPIAPHSGVWKNVLKDCDEADVLMVNANHIRDSFVNRGYDPKKIRVVYLGVREDFRDLHSDRLKSGRRNEVFKVLFTGTFCLLKGAEYILDSLRILQERGISVHYDIVGSVDVPNALLVKYGIDAKNKSGANSSITLYGPLPQDDLKKYLADADCYLFPSLADGCARSGMEALTAGLPAVATYESGLPIVDCETGCVVPMKDAVAIADKIEWLIAHPEERERIGNSAAKMMREKYTWKNYAENVKAIYEELLQNV